jgi:alkylated DNA repair dioxygenase AlkB
LVGAHPPPENLLPYDGTVYLYGPIIEPAQADAWFASLMATIAWQHDEILMFGRRIVTRRKVAWYGDQNYAYTYSHITRSARVWTPELKALKQLIETQCGDTFNSCLLNLYHNGDEGMAWHSDDENTLIPQGSIASLSLGAERKFAFKHKRTQETRSVYLTHGSLLVMKDATQTHWLHSLPKSKKVHGPRINLTFRTMKAGLNG